MEPILYLFDELNVLTGTRVAQKHPSKPATWLTEVLGGTTIAVPKKTLTADCVWCFDEQEKTWKQVEDHRGKEGWVNDESCLIKNIGPLPKGFLTPETYEHGKRTVEGVKQKAFAQLKEKRLNEEYKGAFVAVAGENIRFPSEVKDETRLNSLMSLFEKNPEFTVENWKIAEDVYVTMTAPLAIAVKNASFMHIANMFSVEKHKRAEIDALHIVADVDAWLETELNKGW